MLSPRGPARVFAILLPGVLASLSIVKPGSAIADETAPEELVIHVVPQPLGTTAEFLARLATGSGGEAPHGSSGSPTATTCAEAVQGRVAWNYEDNKAWAAANVANLCSGAEDSVAPAQCFQRVMHGGVNWGGDTQWQWSNALNLCAGTRNAAATVTCFEGGIGRGLNWQQAIEACKGSSASSATVSPVVRPRPVRATPTVGAMPILRATPAAPATSTARLAPTDRPAGIVRAPRTMTAPAIDPATRIVVDRPAVNAQISHNLALSRLTTAASAKLPDAGARIAINQFTFKKEEASSPGSTAPTNAPANQPVDLLAGLTLAVALNDRDVIEIYNSVYADQNRDSGIYYYFPRAYNIAWNQDAGIERGLGLRIAYEQATGGQTERAVRMAVLLDAGVDLQEVQLARKLLEAQSRRQGFTFRELRAFPLAAPPAVSLVDELQHRFNLSADQIAINALSSTLDQIELSWVTDPITAGNLRLTLRDGFGINGAAHFLPPNEQGPAPLIPVNIRIDSVDTFGRLTFERQREMRNQTPFDLKLQHLHALLIENNEPAIYSWTLGDAVLPPRAKVEFDLAHLPQTVDDRAQMMWVSYAIDTSCESCVRATIDGTVIGNVWPDTSTLALQTLSPRAETGAELIEVRTRSRFFDPDTRDIKNGPVLVFAADRDTQTIDPIFLADRTPPDGGPEWPLFEYLVSAVMPSGEMIEGKNWLPAGSERVFIGSHQVRQSTEAFVEP